MRIHIFPDGRSSYHIRLDSFWHFAAPVALLILVAAALVGAGFAAGSFTRKPVALATVPMVDEWSLAVDSQHKEIEDARQNARIALDVLTQRLGELQAHVSRLDALGSRLVKMAKLDGEEFDFAAPPSMGSGDGADAPVDYSLLDALDSMAAQLEQRQDQLQVLDQLIMNRNLQEAIYPAGWPVSSGYISSGYGHRRDPFSGRKHFHLGVDFESKSGVDVLAVADGVVAFAGRQGGYGNMVEIDHGNGYSTRYAHNRKLLIEVGQRVKKGEKLALMGSTGRSTGPHVHFEVLQDGKQINPSKFIKTVSN